MRALEQAVVRDGLKFLSIKDDTFTASRKRTISICKSIQEKNINFVWSCDTRANTLDEEVLLSMRLAGCQRISLGVESGSSEILKSINKKNSLEKIKNAARMARKFGFQVRFYMIIGNRGENLESFQESLELINETRPTEYIFSNLSFYPGTEEFEIFKNDRGITSEIFYEDDFSILFEGFAHDIPNETRNILTGLNNALRVAGSHFLSIKEYKEINVMLDGHPSTHMDLAGAYLRAGDPEEAEPHVKLAIKKGYPLQGMAHNYLAIISAFQGDLDSVKDNLQRAVEIYPHAVVIKNINRFQSWVKSGGPKSNFKLKLFAENNFERHIVPRQPELPSHVDVPGLS